MHLKKLTKEKKLIEEKRERLKREMFLLLLRQEQIKENLIRKIAKKPKA
ncbi:MAG: hypothetical protein KAQ87_00165 [Candidatus Pacebacteria bacterium]|nr:hypothetical protein [Candidatus Paceibacterota bacterium]